jgi:hypothetical protein
MPSSFVWQQLFEDGVSVGLLPGGSEEIILTERGREKVSSFVNYCLVIVRATCDIVVDTAYPVQVVVLSFLIGLLSIRTDLHQKEEGLHQGERPS